ncbi:hypothetical protein [Salipaludibacillus sp. CF4.18]|uniref:hypothetical protein n=1 Tax=Salipaludibacillus sp. CF4.18 TaxID=3373081 RepID=UPI003EE6640E
MYRPTVRMDDVYRDWVESVQESTGLDRAQIIRLAIYAAPFSDVFKEQISQRKQGDTTLPPPAWERVSDGGAWRNSTWKREEREGDTSESNKAGTRINKEFSYEVERTTKGDTTKIQRRERTIHQPKIFKPGSTQKGGIKINFG